MPPKKSRAKTTQSQATKDATSIEASTEPLCSVCATSVPFSADSNDLSAVTCSVCKEAAHRYCAGVSLTEFSSITDESPYVCALCFKTSTTRQMAEMKNCIEALRAEVAELRTTLTQLDSQLQSQSKHGSSDKSSWSEVVKKKSRATPDQRVMPLNRGRAESRSSQPRRQRDGQRQRSPQRNSRVTSENRNRPRAAELTKVQVSGVRKVWGTYLFTSEQAVSNAVKKLTALGDKEVKVIRKYRKYGT